MTWPTVQLGEICEFKYGKALAAGQRDGGDFPVYGSNGIVGWHSKSITDGPTIVVGRKGSFGEVAYSQKPCWPIDTAYYIDSSATKVDLKWLNYRLACLGLTGLNRAAAVPGLNRQDAYRQLLKLPPPEEQRRIAAILDQAESLRAKRRQILSRLDDLLRSMFIACGADQRQTPRLPLKDIIDAVIDYRGKSPSKQSTGVPLITAGLIKNKRILPAREFIAVGEYESWMRRGFPKTGDVLFTSEAPLGEVALVTDPKIALAQRIILLRGKADIVDNLYLMHALTSPSVSAQILRWSTGSTVRGIRQSELLKVGIPVPPLRLQREFESRAASLQALRSHCEDALRHQDVLFASLQSRAFSD